MHRVTRPFRCGRIDTAASAVVEQPLAEFLALVHRLPVLRREKDDQKNHQGKAKGEQQDAQVPFHGADYVAWGSQGSTLDLQLPA